MLQRPYLEEIRFTILTDHNLLKWILNLADITGRLESWRLRLSGFDIDVVHCAGNKHQAADALFRLTATGEDQAPIENDLPVAIFETTPENNPKVCLVTDMTALLDEFNIRASVQIVEDNDAEKERGQPQ